ncbi:ABC transporter substrate-binding protein [Sanguibacter sp. A247]|uniref:ABC transporter substrate-binding protein n=1 Tax=unclassified Sanguibacter TaxID=2645534 RepID=UPI003FD811CA
MSIRKAAAITGLLALSLGVTACSVDEGAQGSADGPITIACGAMEDWCQKMTESFTAKTGIKASFVRLSSGETVARLEAAKASPEFDVWHGGPVDGFGAAKNADLIDAYKSPNRDAIPDKYKDADGYWTGVYVGVLGFCSNQKVLDKIGVAAPTSWDDLLDPKLSKNVSSAHPSTSGTAFTTLWTQVTRLGGEDQGMEYMAKLHNNILQYSKSGTAPGQTAGRGEVAVGLVFSHDCVKYKEEGMSDLVVSFPEDGTGYEIGGVALIKGSKHAEAAKKYIDWTLTAEAQDNGPTVGSFQVLTHPDAKVDERMVTLADVNLVDYDFTAAAAAKKELTTRFDEEIASAPKE